MRRRGLTLAVLVLVGAHLYPGSGERETPARRRDLQAMDAVDHGGRIAQRHSLRDSARPGSVEADARDRDSQGGGRPGGNGPGGNGPGGNGTGGGGPGGGGRDHGKRVKDAYDYRVQVGAISPEAASQPYEYTRFYPDHLRVHRGQTVQFDSLNFHTVSFAPGGEDGRRPLVRRDEGPSGFALTEAAWQRSACGDPDQPACVLDEPDEELSAGIPVWDLTWHVQIDRPAGTTVTYFCSFHPGMQASIEVVDDAEPLPTQETIDVEVEAQIARDTQEAFDHRAMLETQQRHREEDGRTVWTVKVGASTPSGHVSILGYMPRRLVGVRPGDAVEFVSSGPAGHHSVTFPTVLVGDNEISPNNRLTLAAIHPACDFDDRTRGAPGIGGPYEVTPLRCPASLEFLPSPYLAKPHPAPGNLVATALTYHDSGLMWSEEAPEYARGRPAGSGDYFLHRFVAEFPSSGEFQYACTIHGADFMAGTIEVDGLR